MRRVRRFASRGVRLRNQRMVDLSYVGRFSGGLSFSVLQLELSLETYTGRSIT